MWCGIKTRTPLATNSSCYGDEAEAIVGNQAWRNLGPFMSAENVLALLVQLGMFDDAVDLAKKFSLPVIHIFEALSSRCIHLSTNFATAVDPSADKAGWEWLGLNKTLDTVKVKESSIADKAWHLLEVGMEKLDKFEHAVVQRGVARKLLSMGHVLPQWMLSTYKRTNAAELLHIYLTFDLLEQATLLAVEYIDGVMGHGKEYFGLETALHAISPSVWLPHSLLSHVKLALSDAPRNSHFEELSKRFTEKLTQYLGQVKVVTDNMENCQKNMGNVWSI